MVERRLRRMVRGWSGLYEYIPYKESQARAMIATGELPAPIRIGKRAIAWFADDLIAAQEKFLRNQQAE